MQYRFTRRIVVNDEWVIVSNRRYMGGILYVDMIPGKGVSAFTRRANEISRNTPAGNPRWENE